MTERELIQQQQELGDSRFLVPGRASFSPPTVAGLSPWHAPQATVSCTGSVKAEILC